MSWVSDMSAEARGEESTAVWVPKVRLSGLLCTLGESLWYADQKSLEKQTFLERSEKKDLLAKCSTDVTLLRALLYLCHAQLVLRHFARLYKHTFLQMSKTKGP